MNWEQRVVRYLKSFGYETLGFEGGLVFYKDLDGRVWGSNESALNRNMVDWEKAL
jgi:hypothetical protein